MHDHLINSIALSLHSQACRKPSFLCRHSSVCLSEAQLCDGKKDCPEGDDEFCPGACLSIGKCPSWHSCYNWRCSSKTYWDLLIGFSISEEFECQDRSSCLSRHLVCDGRSDCTDGSDEADCPTAAPRTSRSNVMKCRIGSKPCEDGKDCVLYSHVCDGEDDCADGSDELGCGEFSKTKSTVFWLAMWCFGVRLVFGFVMHFIISLVFLSLCLTYDTLFVF